MGESTEGLAIQPGGQRRMVRPNDAEECVRVQSLRSQRHIRPSTADDEIHDPFNQYLLVMHHASWSELQLHHWCYVANAPQQISS